MQAVVDEADLVRKEDFGGIMSGTEKEAVKKLYKRLTLRGYDVRLDFCTDILADMHMLHSP